MCPNFHSRFFSFKNNAYLSLGLGSKNLGLFRNCIITHGKAGSRRQIHILRNLAAFPPSSLWIPPDFTQLPSSQRSRRYFRANTRKLQYLPIRVLSYQIFAIVVPNKDSSTVVKEPIILFEHQMHELWSGKKPRGTGVGRRRGKRFHQRVSRGDEFVETLALPRFA